MALITCQCQVRRSGQEASDVHRRMARHCPPLGGTSPCCAVLAAEWALVRPGIGSSEIRRLGRIDAASGAVAALVHRRRRSDARVFGARTLVSRSRSTPRTRCRSLVQDSAPSPPSDCSRSAPSIRSRGVGDTEPSPATTRRPRRSTRSSRPDVASGDHPPATRGLRRHPRPRRAHRARHRPVSRPPIDGQAWQDRIGWRVPSDSTRRKRCA